MRRQEINQIYSGGGWVKRASQQRKAEREQGRPAGAGTLSSRTWEWPPNQGQAHPWDSREYGPRHLSLWKSLLRERSSGMKEVWETELNKFCSWCRTSQNCCCCVFYLVSSHRNVLEKSEFVKTMKLTLLDCFSRHLWIVPVSGWLNLVQQYSPYPRVLSLTQDPSQGCNPFSQIDFW